MPQALFSSALAQADDRRHFGRSVPHDPGTGRDGSGAALDRTGQPPMEAPAENSFLTTWHWIEPDAAQRGSDRHAVRCIDCRGRADDVGRSCRDGSGSLTNRAGTQGGLKIIRMDKVRDVRLGNEVTYEIASIRLECAVIIACDKSDEFGHTTEVRAMEGCGDADIGIRPIVTHAGKTVDDNFGIARRGRCWRHHSDC